MNVYQDEREFTGRASVMTMGTFDGVHAGHRALIHCALEKARALGVPAVVYTYDRNPLAALCPQRAPVPLMTLEEKLAALEKLGVDCVVVRRFTREFAAIEAEAFLQRVCEALKPRAIVVGYNNTFGARGAGTAQTVESFCAQRGIEAIVVPPVERDGAAVSSTRIRALLSQGETEAAKRLL